MNESKPKVSRRGFLQGSAAGVAAFSIVPRHVLGQGETPPSEQLGGALIGCGGRGPGTFGGLGKNVRMVACCDVDRRRAEGYRNRTNKDAPAYTAGGTLNEGGAVGPTEGGDNTGPVEGSFVSISGGGVIGPQDPGDLSFGGVDGTGACSQGDFDCACNLLLDVAISCGLEMEGGRGQYCNQHTYNDMCDEFQEEFGVSEGQCWSYLDAFASACIAQGCGCFRDDDVIEDTPVYTDVPPEAR